MLIEVVRNYHKLLRIEKLTITDKNEKSGQILPKMGNLNNVQQKMKDLGQKLGQGKHALIKLQMSSFSQVC